MSSNVTDTALEVWAESKPDGMTSSLARLLDLLPAVAVRVPGALDSPERARRLNQVFFERVGSPSIAERRTESGGSVVNADCGSGEFKTVERDVKAEEEGSTERTPLFLDWLHPLDGQVHLLYFWRAFCDATYYVDGSAGSAGNSLCSELETVRDLILCAFECSDSRQIHASAIVDAVHVVASTSAAPKFWQTVLVESAGWLSARQSRITERAGREQSSYASGQFGLEEVAMLVLSWVQAASSWEQRSEEQTKDEKQVADAKKMAEENEEGLPVLLHIYDVSQEEGIQKINRVLAHRFSPVKFGGLFHAGVEVLGLEWSYGFSENDTVPGVCCMEPRAHPQHHYRQTVTLRRTNVSQEDIGVIISTLLEEYPGHDYDLLRRNCCHFADDFAQRLGVGRIPGWIHRLARLGAGLDSAVQTFQGMQMKYYGPAKHSVVEDLHDEQPSFPERMLVAVLGAC
eukprot:TRINITY_DN76510_c0_g1_i1.p1 TRINITY_DN76510_c0_g1~~TRINITY_DN76510_c0_g1_i1.p1  ORF type:complete len:458 (-),score=77.04 TRINITY_DN76510_c0_g1_i1:65-1438(-)